MLHKNNLELVLSQLKRSLLPEVYDLVGGDTTIEFIRLFGGTNLRVPTMTELNRIVRDNEIFEALNKNPRSLERLSKKYNLGKDRVEQIYERMSSTCRQELSSLPEGVKRVPRTYPGISHLIRTPRLG